MAVNVPSGVSQSVAGVVVTVTTNFEFGAVRVIVPELIAGGQLE
jgi:hypothetical protein